MKKLFIICLICLVLIYSNSVYAISYEEQLQLQNDKLLDNTIEYVVQYIDKLPRDVLGKIFYSRNDMQAWISLCLIAHVDMIPLHMFPESADENYVLSLVNEAGYQNCIVALRSEAVYSVTSRRLLVTYFEDIDISLERQISELSAVKDIVNTLFSDRDYSNAEKSVMLSNYIKDIASYNFDSYINKDSLVQIRPVPDTYSISHRPYGVLIDGSGVCESYAEAYALLCRYSGVDCLCEIGYSGDELHEWNVVNIGSYDSINFIRLDVTYNDSLNIDSSSMFNITYWDSYISDGRSYSGVVEDLCKESEYYKNVLKDK